ncbi:MAG: LPS O-antigen chain length determinant protein WzzB [Ewingella americana]|jgi:chain length determinant protein (polysaccharide antigen chain regulator)|uniref:LPS O-antigen chain length determinant protein WzzB n=1 Tax=Ewingella americana TaxID=41202 RepID=UPI00242B1A16|nr:LPS O-antigen chain length determinant protein WzzB [Ewingella americana]MCI1678768.1 LPS O-antigen chain length determinant protein WzzB [Ewingella americana]MCI1854355.1 LPS O-antigen chain length determinant protein WzzB [Ewingella americana]MCI1861655.1 LPS O-antigen chain length determinant protein WzzB [Ewingella americana]MCI2141001.1 LPS O-antigen chain length determinant protein WzzB [Ewingella americana]MCI2164119.1 LPS O-antigen chain length determinant protein WzzB [Ewingella am
MNQDDNNFNVNRSSRSNEDFDLIDVLIQLKNGKFTIIAFVIIALVVAVIYLFAAKQKWTSEAIVTIPDSGQIANYNNAMNVLYSQNLSNAPTVADIQGRFFGRFNSAISALSEQLDNQENPEKLTISPVSKDGPIPLKITYTSKTAGEAQKTLTTYIQQINKRVVTEMDDDLQANINFKIDDLKDALSTKEKVAQEKKDKRLDVLNQALIIAEQSNIKNTLVQQAENLSEDTLFVLGSNALSSTIKNEATRPLPLDDTYYNDRQSLLAITDLKSKPSVTYALRYVMKPNLPIHRDSPKKVLVIILGGLIGLILGSVVVIVRNVFKNYTPR